ncbi:MAG TPA: PadR family transcriptional regulator [Steroidobacteraceae bacterium]|jgi:DNA-binding PadR family transcriptional regulator
MKAELLILGVLHRGNFHPYEIKRRLKQAMVECYTDVEVGTLYYAVTQLAKYGLIAKVSSERVARGGVRTIYGITPKGKRRFLDLLHLQFDHPGSVAATLYSAMLFLHLTDPAIIAPLLQKRIAQQAGLIQEVVEIRKRLEPMLSTGGRHLIKHLEQQRRLDLRWLQEVLKDVAEGRVADVADPRKLADPSIRRRS